MGRQLTGGYMDETTLQTYNDPTGEDALMSRIPLLMGDERKMEYLAYRATGFPVRQAADLTGVKMDTVRGWRKRDKHFKNVEENRLAELQTTVARDVVKLEFFRNMRLLTLIDAKVVNKVVGVRDNELLEELTAREFEWLKTVRKHYDAGALMQLEKALNPEADSGETKIVVVLGWGKEGEIVESNFNDSPGTAPSYEVASAPQ